MNYFNQLRLELNNLKLGITTREDCYNNYYDLRFNKNNNKNNLTKVLEDFFTYNSNLKQRFFSDDNKFYSLIGKLQNELLCGFYNIKLSDEYRAFDLTSKKSFMTSVDKSSQMRYLTAKEYIYISKIFSYCLDVFNNITINNINIKDYAKNIQGYKSFSENTSFKDLIDGLSKKFFEIGSIFREVFISTEHIAPENIPFCNTRVTVSSIKNKYKLNTPKRLTQVSFNFDQYGKPIKSYSHIFNEKIENKLNILNKFLNQYKQNNNLPSLKNLINEAQNFNLYKLITKPSYKNYFTNEEEFNNFSNIINHCMQYENYKRSIDIVLTRNDIDLPTNFYEDALMYLHAKKFLREYLSNELKILLATILDERYNNGKQTTKIQNIKAKKVVSAFFKGIYNRPMDDSVFNLEFKKSNAPIYTLYQLKNNLNTSDFYDFMSCKELLYLILCCNTCTNSIKSKKLSCSLTNSLQSVRKNMYLYGKNIRSLNFDLVYDMNLENLSSKENELIKKLKSKLEKNYNTGCENSNFDYGNN